MRSNLDNKLEIDWALVCPRLLMKVTRENQTNGLSIFCGDGVLRKQGCKIRGYWDLALQRAIKSSIEGVFAVCWLWLSFWLTLKLKLESDL